MRAPSPIALAILLAAAAAAPAAAETLTPDQQLTRDLLRELVEIDTQRESTRAAEAMAARLRAAGFLAEDVQVVGPKPGKMNLVARLHGRGQRKPLLLLAHLDVVAARPEDWSLDPFRLTERDGWLYGRGTEDDKGMAAIWVSTLIRMRRDGYRPDRDLIVALTADEEGGDDNGVAWLLANRRELVDAAYCLNEGGGGEIKDGRYLLNELQASEKVYQSYQLEVRDKGGHSSLPTRDNAIYTLAAGLQRLAGFAFPVGMNDVTRGWFERMAKLETGRTAADMRALLRTPPDARAAARLSATPYYNALLRTTCTATRLEAGHADNALPQTARALVNCRILPWETPADVERTLARVLGDPRIVVTVRGKSLSGPSSPLSTEIVAAFERASGELWPGVPVAPTMMMGATDGLFLRNAGIPTYGTGFFTNIDDVRAHGKDERVGVKEFLEGTRFLDRLVRLLSGDGR